MIEYFLAIVLAMATAWFLRFFGLRSFEGIIEALAQLVGGWRGEGWPRGVQEEDRDRPWGTPAMISNHRAPKPTPQPTLSRVRPTVSAR